MDSRAKGRAAENIAVNYLLEKGYALITRNYQTKVGEIDCIVKDPEGTLVFVEVKSCSSMCRGNPLYRVTASKQRTLFKLATMYMKEHGIKNQPCRFDVISIVKDEVDHLKNAFLRL